LEWVVIVPYKAQAELIRRRLRRKLTASQDLNLQERVATVDSFQGGECSRVVYGFTRSNQNGNVGFLRELRRLNVAMTRTQEQLVMVGDAETLTQAQDRPFRETMEALREHVQYQGEWLSAEECQARLVALGEPLS
jgi:superfamily I DNA and/or RNA helicase